MLKTISKLIIVTVGCGYTAFLIYVVFLTGFDPPIETYAFPRMSTAQLRKSIVELVESNTNQQYRDSDTVGIGTRRLAFYMEISITKGSNQNEYLIRYEEIESIWKESPYSEIGLISAFKEKYTIGGYQKKDPGVEDMVKVFEDAIIKPLVAVRAQ